MSYIESRLKPLSDRYFKRKRKEKRKKEIMITEIRMSVNTLNHESALLQSLLQYGNTLDEVRGTKEEKLTRDDYNGLINYGRTVTLCI
jgi:hypothetical protein